MNKCFQVIYMFFKERQLTVKIDTDDEAEVLTVEDFLAKAKTIHYIQQRIIKIISTTLKIIYFIHLVVVLHRIQNYSIFRMY